MEKGKIRSATVLSLTLTFALFSVLGTTVLASAGISQESLSPGEWTRVADMNESRALGPGAVLLDDGRILVAGGELF